MRRFLQTVIAMLGVLLWGAVTFALGFAFSRGLWQEVPPLEAQGAAPAIERGIPSSPTQEDEDGPQFYLLEEIWQVLKDDYVDKDALDAELLGEGALRGLLETLGDPHTSWISAEDFDLDKPDLTGEFEGIGASVAMRDNVLIVLAPFPGSPAERAGIRPGDAIVTVDGEPTSRMGLEEAVRRIRGPRGTPVTLGIRHAGEDTVVEIVVIRERIMVSTVFSNLAPVDSSAYAKPAGLEDADNIAYIRITGFSERTNSELKTILEEARLREVEGIVLDVRANPGGLLSATVEVTSQFLSDGVVLYEVDAEGNRTTWEVQPGGLATDVDLVVLADEHSASGSEVLVGAIQDAGRAPIIGTTTFGKGTVNLPRRLSDGSVLYVSHARWLTPNGRLIEGTGLLPDIVVEFTEEDLNKRFDAQLARALEYLKSGV